jgi:autotransporter-associated beta strand protein
MKPNSKNRFLRSILPLTGMTLAVPSALAATRYWDGGTADIAGNGNSTSAGGTGTWNTTLKNWDAGNVPYVSWNNAANDTADINGGTQTITLGTNITIGGMIAKAGASGVTIAEGSGLNTITLGLTTTQLSVAASTTTSRALNLNAVVTGNNLSVVGPSGTPGGFVNLNRINTYSGNTSVNNTTLRIGNSGTAAQLGSGNYSGTINLVSASSFLNYASSLNQTLAGAISGTGALTKSTSNSSLSLGAANTYTGATSITAGTLALTGTGSINNTSGITLNGSTAKLLHTSSTAITPVVTVTQGTLTGSGTVDTVNVGDATGGIVSNNDGLEGAALTIGTLTFNGAATVNTFGNAAAAIATTTLATNAAGLVTINPTAATWTTGSTYDLISYGGGVIGGGDFAQFTLGTITGKAARQTGTLINTGTAIAVQIGGTTDFPYWVGDTNSQWDTSTNNNWKLFTGGTYTNFIATDAVLFNDNATGASPVAVNVDSADVVATTTTFENSAKNYVLSSSGGFGLATGALVKNGSGTASFGTLNTSTTTTTINNGTLVQTGGTATVGTLQMGGMSSAPGTTAALTFTGGTFSATSFDVLSSGDNMASSISIGGTAEVTLPAFPTNAKGTDATAAITFDSTTGFLSPLAASTTYLPAGTFNNAYLTANGAKFNVPSGKAITIGQALQDAVSPAAAGTITKSGVGALTLTGANTFTGTTTINEGFLQLGNLSALGGTGSIAMTGGNLRPTISNVTLTAPITLAGAVTIGAPTNNVGNQAFNPFNLNGGIGGTGDVIFDSSLNTNVIQTVVLGAACSYSGATLVDTSGGTASQIIVKLGVTNALPVTTVVTIDGKTGTGTGRYAEINLNGFDQTLAGLTNVTRTNRVQRIVNSDVSAAATLTIHNTDDHTFSGNLGSGANGSVSSIPTPGSTTGSNFALTKSGPGTFTLSGNNPFYGATRINAGILSLGNSLALQGSPLDTLNSVTGDATNGLRTTVTALTLGGLTGNKNLSSLFTTSGGYDGVTSLTLNPGTGAAPSYSAVIADGAPAMNLIKTGAGTQILDGAQSYTGTTTVSNGTLQVNGSLNAASAVTVSGGNLGGTGTVGGNVVVEAAGNIAPGASAGTLNIGGNLDLAAMAASTGKLKFELDSLAGTNDRIAVSGTLTLGTGALGFGNFEFTNLGGLQTGTYTLVTSGGITGGDSLDPANLTGAIGALNGALRIDGSNIVLDVTIGGYSSWQSANGTSQAIDLDHDNDGVANGVEYFLSGPADSSSFTSLPPVIGNSVTWIIGAGYNGAYGVDYVVQTSTNLVNPWTDASPGTGAGQADLTTTPGQVKYTFPAGTRNFVRLKVTGP